MNATVPIQSPSAETAWPTSSVRKPRAAETSGARRLTRDIAHRASSRSNSRRWRYTRALGRCRAARSRARASTTSAWRRTTPASAPVGPCVTRSTGTSATSPTKAPSPVWLRDAARARDRRGARPRPATRRTSSAPSAGAMPRPPAPRRNGDQLCPVTASPPAHARRAPAGPCPRAAGRPCPCHVADPGDGERTEAGDTGTGWSRDRPRADARRSTPAADAGRDVRRRGSLPRRTPRPRRRRRARAQFCRVRTGPWSLPAGSQPGPPGFVVSPMQRSIQSTSSTGRLSIGRWPASSSPGSVIPKRSRTTCRMKSGGKNRSSVQIRKSVGTVGIVSSGNGFSIGVPDWLRMRVPASEASAGATSCVNVVRCRHRRGARSRVAGRHEVGGRRPVPGRLARGRDHGRDQQHVVDGHAVTERGREAAERVGDDDEIRPAVADRGHAASTRSWPVRRSRRRWGGRRPRCRGSPAVRARPPRGARSTGSRPHRGSTRR